MLAFEVWVNGDRLCTASTATNCVLSTILSWASRRPDSINFCVGGVASDDRNCHVDWATPQIKIGDEIRVRVIDTDEYDQPDERYVPGRRQQEPTEARDS